MRSIVGGTLFTIAGLALGVATASQLIESSASPEPAGGGLWRSYPAGNSTAADPYALSHYTLEGRLPPADRQTTEFIARWDANGAALDGDCHYEIAGMPPRARWWSMALRGGGTANPSSLISSDDAVYGADGTLTVSVGPRPLPGNWLETPLKGRFSIVFVEAETSLTGSEAGPPRLSIKLTEC
jgi:hypothetical protein